MNEYSNNLKIVFDTNIYIAAFLKAGLADFLIRLANERRFILSVSPEIINEIKEKLYSKHGPTKEVENFLSLVDESAQLVIIKEGNKTNIVKSDPDDNKIIECALAVSANLIVSLDKHLLKLKNFKGIAIIHPKTLTWMIPDY